MGSWEDLRTTEIAPGQLKELVQKTAKQDPPTRVAEGSARLPPQGEDIDLVIDVEPVVERPRTRPSRNLTVPHAGESRAATLALVLVLLGVIAGAIALVMR